MKKSTRIAKSKKAAKSPRTAKTEKKAQGRPIVLANSVVEVEEEYIATLRIELRPVPGAQAKGGQRFQFWTKGEATLLSASEEPEDEDAEEPVFDEVKVEVPWKKHGFIDSSTDPWTLGDTVLDLMDELDARLVKAMESKSGSEYGCLTDREGESYFDVMGGLEKVSWWALALAMQNEVPALPSMSRLQKSLLKSWEERLYGARVRFSPRMGFPVEGMSMKEWVSALQDPKFVKRINDSEMEMAGGAFSEDVWLEGKGLGSSEPDFAVLAFLGACSRDGIPNAFC
jgi:hypothetical protein